MAGMTYAERDRILITLGYSCYAEYLQSALWRAIRDGVISRSNGACHLCKDRASHVHHRSYDERVLKGDLRDNAYLVALCETCHNAIEFKGKAKRTFEQAQKALDLLESMPRRKPKRSPKPPKAKTIRPLNLPTCYRCKVNLVAIGYSGQPSKFCKRCKKKTSPADAARYIAENKLRDSFC